MYRRMIFALSVLLLVSGGCHPAGQTVEDRLEQAKQDGCVVHENGDITQGAETFEEFVRQTERGEPAKVQLAFYYTLEDPSRYAQEYYESVKDDYPMLFLQELSFDGAGYTLRWREEGEEIVRDYQYLMKYEGPAESDFALYSSYVRYVLTNDNTVTWEQLMEGVFSSGYGDYIEHNEVYTDLIYDT